jgi:hypothetical protein
MFKFINITNCVSNVRDLLFILGLNYVWISQDASSVSYDFAKQRIIDQFYWQLLINVQVYKYSAKNSNMLAKNAYVQIYMQDKLTQNDIRFQQHSYCNTNYVWISQDASSVSYDFAKQRIIDQFVQQWSTSVCDCEKLYL